ncbi:hypothetical protein HUN39_16705 [Methylocystis sp. FS]|uniref:hypothetical protein n=1 Tax=Methylocystis silviterrae TaxID=2743612 RepID=UPI001583F26B|nr:hypothetical protein [Methylocystis silviterrae]NUJ81634.1 hypothetical protein [Methylocystis silviterrae]
MPVAIDEAAWEPPLTECAPRNFLESGPLQSNCERLKIVPAIVLMLLNHDMVQSLHLGFKAVSQRRSWRGKGLKACPAFLARKHSVRRLVGLQAFS